MVTLISFFAFLLSNFINPYFLEDPAPLSDVVSVVDLGDYGSFNSFGSNWIYFPSGDEFFSSDSPMFIYVSSSGNSFRLCCLEGYSIFDSSGDVLRDASSSSLDGYFLSSSFTFDRLVYISNFTSTPESSRLLGIIRNWFPSSDIVTDFSDDFMNESITLFQRFIHGFSFSLIGLFVFMLVILGFLFYSVYRMIRGSY